MRLKISHTTHYSYDSAVSYSLQQARLHPKTRAGQNIISWNTHIDGGKLQTEFTDYHNNHVSLISLDAGAQEISILGEGEIDTADMGGIIGEAGGYVPLWLFMRPTSLTTPGKGIREIAKSVGKKRHSDIDKLHALSKLVLETVQYKSGDTDARTTAEQAIENGKGVCQDHAHIFISCARDLGYPSRYVSGYLMMNDRIDQGASHAWAEAHVDGMGWIGFDISNGISPDDRYVRVATGLDYRDAAPISGIRLGNSIESMNVSIQVQQ